MDTRAAFVTEILAGVIRRLHGSPCASRRVACAVFASALAVSAVGFCAVANAQETAAPVIAQSGPNVAAGASDTWDLTAGDMTYKVDRNEIWVLDGHRGDADDQLPLDPTVILTFDANDFDSQPGEVLVTLPESLGTGARALGLAEIGHGALRGSNLVLVDSEFLSLEPPLQFFGLVDDNGGLLSEFQSALGIESDAHLTSIAVHPTADQIVAYDAIGHKLYLLDFFFTVIGSPMSLPQKPFDFAARWNPPTGSAAGVGLTFTASDLVLVSMGFENDFNTEFALEFNTVTQRFAGRAIDLSGPDVANFAFTSLALGQRDGQQALFALNYAEESLYAFELDLRDTAEPVQDVMCEVDESTSTYTVTWTSPTETPDEIRVFENGVQVTSLPGFTTSYSTRNILGTVVVEIATVENGLVSFLRPRCEWLNSQLPRLDGVTTSNTSFPSSSYGDLAATRNPTTPDEFRIYLYLAPNFVIEFDNTLQARDSIVLDPAPETVSPTGGVAMAETLLFETRHLALLDSDGFQNDGVPGVGFYSLFGSRGDPTVILSQIDMSAITTRPFFHSWDYFEEGNEKYFVALGRVDNAGVNEFWLVRFDLLPGPGLRAVREVPVPQRELTPFADQPHFGRSVSILPNGLVLVAGSDTFGASYTEALLTTRFDHSESGAQFIGYAQGLPTTGQLFDDGILGSGTALGLATAYFPEGNTGAGIGVSYHMTDITRVLSNPGGGAFVLRPRMYHSENDVAHPDLRAEQLLATNVALSPDEVLSLAPVAANVPPEVTDFYVTLVNQSLTDRLPLSLQISLDDITIGSLTRSVTLGPGRHHRIRYAGRTENQIQVSVTNGTPQAAEVRVIVGAVGIVEREDETFQRGDCQSDGAFQITDPIFGLNALFSGHTQPTCVDACDFDDNGSMNIGDMVAMLNHLFNSGTPPALPGLGSCGPDPTLTDELINCVYENCP